ncbi:hypothetical protein DL96DRAFT_1581358 [Flagelloscypha sp. PMI_526]|nr:hypothetical protein DL96DRAFT_1581358 [Flagelloscypha sp. PMI_526]
MDPALPPRLDASGSLQTHSKGLAESTGSHHSSRASSVSQMEIERAFITETHSELPPGPPDTQDSFDTILDLTFDTTPSPSTPVSSRKPTDSASRSSGTKRKRSASGSPPPSIIPQASPPKKQPRREVPPSPSRTLAPKYSSKTPVDRAESPWPADVQLLGNYTCPICFCPPKKATLTPCGHISCGKCLWESVNSSLKAQQRGPVPEAEKGARCPVCREKIEGWDGRGKGVRGLKLAVRTVLESG